MPSLPSIPGVTPTHEFEIAMTLVNPAVISHWSALHHYGLTEQIPRKVFVLTTVTASVPRLRGTRASQANGGYRVGETTYHFIQVRPERFFGTEKVWLEDARVTITDPERTLLDGLSMPRVLAPRFARGNARANPKLLISFREDLALADFLRSAARTLRSA